MFTVKRYNSAFQKQRVRFKKCSSWIWTILDRLKIYFYFPDYEIVTVTGDKNGASTSANVYVTIEGRTGVTPKLHLKDFTRTNFRQNSSDTFKIRTNCVGPMKKIKVEHDNTGLGAGWYLERVSILRIVPEIKCIHRKLIDSSLKCILIFHSKFYEIFQIHVHVYR